MAAGFGGLMGNLLNRNFSSPFTNGDNNENNYSSNKSETDQTAKSSSELPPVHQSHHISQSNQMSHTNHRYIQYPNPRILTAETVATLPPPGQTGPSLFTFSPDSRYLSFLSSTHINVTSAVSDSEASTRSISNTTGLGDTKYSFLGNHNNNNTNERQQLTKNNVDVKSSVISSNSGERRLCAIDMLPLQHFYQDGAKDQDQGVNCIVQPHVFPLLNSSVLETKLDSSESQISLEERLRRERQRLHTTGVTQFSWSHISGTICQQECDPNNIQNENKTSDDFNNQNTIRISPSDGEGMEVQDAYRNNGDSFSHNTDALEINTEQEKPRDDGLRILIPFHGNIYVQDGVGAPLRLIYDKKTSLSLMKNTQHKEVTNPSQNVVMGDAGAIDPQLSPDGSMVAFVVAGEIYIIPAGPHPTSQIRHGHTTFNLFPIPVRLTSGATWVEDFSSPRASDGKDHSDRCITHGLADFVAQEEIDRYRGFWWNPSSDGIAFTKVDETEVPPYRIAHQGRDGTGSATFEDHRYPFAGEKNPTVTLGFVYIKKADIFEANQDKISRNWEANGFVKWLEAPEDSREYLARVTFLPDGCICSQWQNRLQNKLVLIRTDPSTGASSVLLTEKSEYWINLNDMFHVLPFPVSPPGIDLSPNDGSFSFLFASERTRFCHLYLYTFIPYKDGNFGGETKFIGAVSGGDWVVESIVGINAERNVVYIMGTYDSPLERHLYELPILSQSTNGKYLPPPNPIRLTINPGMHDIVMDDLCRIVIDSSSDLTRPTSVKVYTIDNKKLRHLFSLHDSSAQERKKGSVGGNFAPPELINFKTSDGTQDLHAVLYLPDPKVHGPGPYPLISSVYGGPHVQRVNRSWSQCTDMRAQRLRSLGFVVIKCDNRGSSRRGLAFESCIYKRLGRLEVLDQVTAVRQLVMRGIADPNRVGIYGWSYGGYLAAMCLCRAPDIFHSAVAGAPVTSWDGYDTHYTERYMSTPQSNPDGYREAAVFDHVANMRGKLMIVHGLIDENVHFRHTARLINRLIAAGKDYDLLLFPDERHSPRRLRDRVYMEQRISDFFINTLRKPNIHLEGSGNYVRPMAGHL